MEFFSLLYRTPIGSHKRSLTGFAISVLTLITASSISASSRTGIESPVSVHVSGVSDGDTIKVATLEKAGLESVRIMSIDCPEKTQPFGIAAKKVTSENCLNTDVMLIRHGVDRNHRTIGDVVLGNGIHLNSLLVRNGLAWWYKKYAPNDLNLHEQEVEARRKKLGLWSSKNSIAPREYRQAKRARPPMHAQDVAQSKMFNLVGRRNLATPSRLEDSPE